MNSSGRLNGRLVLYGIAAILAGMIIAVLGPPGRSERPPQPHPEDLFFVIPGYSLTVIGCLMLLYRLIRSLRGP